MPVPGSAAPSVPSPARSSVGVSFPPASPPPPNSGSSPTRPLPSTAGGSSSTGRGEISIPPPTDGAGTEGAEGAGAEGAGADGLGTNGADTEGAGTEGADTEGAGTDGAGAEGAETDGAGTLITFRRGRLDELAGLGRPAAGGLRRAHHRHRHRVHLGRRRRPGRHQRLRRRQHLGDDPRAGRRPHAGAPGEGRQRGSGRRYGGGQRRRCLAGRRRRRNDSGAPAERGHSHGSVAGADRALADLADGAGTDHRADGEERAGRDGDPVGGTPRFVVAHVTGARYDRAVHGVRGAVALAAQQGTDGDRTFERHLGAGNGEVGRAVEPGGGHECHGSTPFAGEREAGADVCLLRSSLELPEGVSPTRPVTHTEDLSPVVSGRPLDVNRYPVRSASVRQMMGKHA